MAIAFSAAGAELAWFGPALQDLGNANLLLFFVVFVAAAMAIGAPIAFCFMLGTLSFIAFATQIPLSIVPDRIDGFYLACAVGRVAPDVAIKSVWPHLAALLVALLLITLIPWISIGFL